MRAKASRSGWARDGEKENNNLDLIEEMKFASLLQKVSTLDPTTGDPADVLAMATIDGARALGLAQITGSLEPGKRADIVVVDLPGLHTTPMLSGSRLQRGRPPGVLLVRPRRAGRVDRRAAGRGGWGSDDLRHTDRAGHGPGRGRGTVRPPGRPAPLPGQ